LSSDRRGRGGGNLVVTSKSIFRRDSLDKSGLFPEWKKMSAPKSQVEKVNFRLLFSLLFFLPSLPSFLPSFFFYLNQNLNQNINETNFASDSC
jgi:hypothetical protein